MFASAIFRKLGLLLMAATALAQRGNAQSGRAPEARESPDSARVQALASRVTAAVSPVKSGDIVIVSGGRQTVPFLEAIGAAFARQGAAVVAQLQSDRIDLALSAESPVQTLAAGQRALFDYYVEQTKRAAVFVNLPQYDRPDVFNALGADTARVRHLMENYQSGMRRVTDAQNGSKALFVNVAYPPMQHEAAWLGVDSSVYDQMRWNALTADYDAIARTAAAIQRVLDAGKTIHITTEAGTYLELPLAGGHSMVDAGTVPNDRRRARLAAQRNVSLPGGTVTALGDERFIAGHMAIPRMACGGLTVVNLSFDVRGGPPLRVHADSNEKCITDLFVGFGNAGTTISEIILGVNPALHVMESDHGPGALASAAEGMVTLHMGYDADLGGSNFSPATMEIPLAHATLAVDGRTLIRNGQLVTPVTMNTQSSTTPISGARR